jgi:high affinity Mn2+ porin
MPRFACLRSKSIQAYRLLTALALAMAATMAAAQNQPVDAPSAAPANPQSAEAQAQTWNWHIQTTITGQGYPSLSAKYTGVNSLPTAGQARETVSLDFFGGYRLWRGAEFHADLLTWQGFGLDDTLGIEDFTNGEAYKAGTRPPHEDLARFFIRQTIGFGGKIEAVPSDQLTLAGDQPATRLTFTFGRYSSKDIFDNNAYANDPRKQFMNWALVANATWDYPADALGYTTGISVELKRPKWALRYGFFQLSNQQNGFTAEDQFLTWPGVPTAGDDRFFHDWGMVVEGERRYSIGGHPGVVRPLAFVNQGEYVWLRPERGTGDHEEHRRVFSRGMERRP